LLILIMLGAECKRRSSSLCSFLHPPRSIRTLLWRNSATAKRCEIRNCKTVSRPKGQAIRTCS
jgi:hypothetical protein